MADWLTSCGRVCWPTLADTDPEEVVTVTGVDPMTLRRVGRQYDDWREHHGLTLVISYREAGKDPTTFDMADLGRFARRAGKPQRTCLPGFGSPYVTAPDQAPP